MEQILLQWEPERRTYTVGELNAEIRELLDSHFDDIWVSGEISGCKQAASGHWYFNLKDEAGNLRCVCFRNSARLLKFKPQDGVAVLARGRIDVYEARGEYQLLVETLEPQGHGALQFAFEQLKKKLAEDGLFAPERKRPLPAFPRRVGIVTSPTGAVIRDILNVLGRRHPGLHIRLFPALVQGEGSIEAVCRGLHYFHVSRWADVVIIARGGGSLEDLWTFNEEQVAYAIANCSTPVISAIGHETDFTIADFVADLRAPTPSAAAELVIPPRDQFLDQIEALRRRAKQAIDFRISESKRRLEEQGVSRARAVLQRGLARHQQRVDELDFRLRDAARRQLTIRERNWQLLMLRLQKQDLRLPVTSAHRELDCAVSLLRHNIKEALNRVKYQWQPLEAQLQQLDPTKVLNRGYALVETADGQVVKEPQAAPPGASVVIQLAKGKIAAKIV